MAADLAPLFPTPLVRLATGWFLLIGLVWGLFAGVEKAASKEFRVRIARWLTRVEPDKKVTRWGASFAEVFDTVFGPTLLSWKCFWRSAIASLIAWIAVAILNGGFTAALARQYPVEVFAFGLSCAVLVDFLSLCESRWMIRILARRSGGLRSANILLLDYVLSAAIFVLGFNFMYLGLSHHAPYNVTKWPSELWRVLTWNREFGAFLPGAQSTFLTSIWLWLYALSGLLIRLGGRVGIVAVFLRGALDIENKPFTALAIVTNALITVAFLIALPFVLL
jgi:hypothetical protein